MEELSSRMRLEEHTLEDEIGALDAFLREEMESPNNRGAGVWDSVNKKFGYKKDKDEGVEEALRKISSSIFEEFECWENRGKKSIREGSYSEMLIFVLKTIRDVMDGVNKAPRCERGSSGICLKYLYLSMLMVRKHLWGAVCCIDRYCSSRCIIGKGCVREYGVVEDTSGPRYFVGGIMLVLCNIVVLGESISGKNISPGISRVALDIHGSARSCVSFHFSNEKCLKLLSKNLKRIFNGIYQDLKVILRSFSSRDKKYPNLDKLKFRLSDILDIIAGIYDSSGLKMFQNQFFKVKLFIIMSSSLIEKIQSHVNEMRQKIHESDYEEIMKKVGNIHRVICGFLADMVRRNWSNSLS
jgi:hypothetical protein